jgi:hypothetical protein
VVVEPAATGTAYRKLGRSALRELSETAMAAAGWYAVAVTGGGGGWPVCRGTETSVRLAASCSRGGRETGGWLRDLLGHLAAPRKVL